MRLDCSKSRDILACFHLFAISLFIKLFLTKYLTIPYYGTIIILYKFILGASMSCAKYVELSPLLHLSRAIKTVFPHV